MKIKGKIVLKKLTLEEIQKKMDEDNPYHSLILDNTDINHSKILCGRCNNVFYVRYHTITRNKFKLCQKCAKEVKGTRLTNVDVIKKEVESYGFIPMFDAFSGVHDPLVIKDQDGYIGYIPIVSIRKNAQISKFAKYNPYALQNLRKYCELNNVNCFIPEQEYLGWEFPIKVMCKCGKIYETTITHFLHDHQYQCLDCSGSKSKNEKAVEVWLNSKNICFIEQYKFSDCKNIKELPFDFYLPDYNICIEVDGEGHDRPTRFNGMDLEKAKILFERTQYRDQIKTDYCFNNNITLIRVSYKDIQNENYKNILSSIIH